MKWYTQFDGPCLRPGMVVKASFRLTDVETGLLLDEADDETPLVWLFGRGQLLPAVERVLEGRRPTEVVDVVVPPEEAFGERVDQALQTIDRGAFGEDPPPEVGMSVFADFGDGPQPHRIVRVTEEGVVLDTNHPLAGKHLRFHLRIHAFRDATAREQETLIARDGDLSA